MTVTFDAPNLDLVRIAGALTRFEIRSVAAGTLASRFVRRLPYDGSQLDLVIEATVDNQHRMMAALRQLGAQSRAPKPGDLPAITPWVAVRCPAANIDVFCPEARPDRYLGLAHSAMAVRAARLRAGGHEIRVGWSGDVVELMAAIGRPSEAGELAALTAFEADRRARTRGPEAA